MLLLLLSLLLLLLLLLLIMLLLLLLLLLLPGHNDGSLCDFSFYKYICIYNSFITICFTRIILWLH